MTSSILIAKCFDCHTAVFSESVANDKNSLQTMPVSSDKHTKIAGECKVLLLAYKVFSFRCYISQLYGQDMLYLCVHDVQLVTAGLEIICLIECPNRPLFIIIHTNLLTATIS